MIIPQQGYWQYLQEHIDFIFLIFWYFVVNRYLLKKVFLQNYSNQYLSTWVRFFDLFQ